MIEPGEVGIVKPGGCLSILEDTLVDRENRLNGDAEVAGIGILPSEIASQEKGVVRFSGSGEGFLELPEKGVEVDGGFEFLDLRLGRFLRLAPVLPVGAIAEFLSREVEAEFGGFGAKGGKKSLGGDAHPDDRIHHRDRAPDDQEAARDLETLLVDLIAEGLKVVREVAAPRLGGLFGQGFRFLGFDEEIFEEIDPGMIVKMEYPGLGEGIGGARSGRERTRGVEGVSAVVVAIGDEKVVRFVDFQSAVEVVGSGAGEEGDLPGGGTQETDSVSGDALDKFPGVGGFVG